MTKHALDFTLVPMANFRAWGWCAVVSLVAACSSFNGTDPGGGSNGGGGDLDGGREGSAVTGGSADHSFTIAAPGALVVTRGDSATLTITVERGTNLAPALSARLTGAPSGVTADPATGSGDSATLTIKVDGAQTQGTAPGTIEVTIPHSDDADSTTVTAPLSLFVRGKSGELDTTFGTNGIMSTIFPVGTWSSPDLVVGSDDSLYLVVKNGSTGLVAHLDGAGKLDTAYGSNGNAPIFKYAEQAALQDDGKLVVVGGINNSSTPTRATTVARLNKDGSPDLQFGPQTAGPGANTVATGGVAGQNLSNTGVAIRYDGDIFVAFNNFDGTASHAGQLRFAPDGSLRTTYGSGGGVRALDGNTQAFFIRNDPASASRGSVAHLATVNATGSFVQRTADNGPDPDANVGTTPKTFGTDGNVTATFGTFGSDTRPALLNDGSCIVPLFLNYEEGSGGILRKFDVGGSPVTGYGTGGFVSIQGYAVAIAVAPDQSTFVTVGSSGNDGVLRYTQEGTRVSNWNVARVDGGYGYRGVVVEKTGRVVTTFTLSSGAQKLPALASFWL